MLFRAHSTSVPGRSALILAEHKEIVEALEKRDEAQAIASMNTHLSNALNSILVKLESCEKSEKSEVA
jgi:DNA-binding GntR family transcriptional regulator